MRPAEVGKVIRWNRKGKLMKGTKVKWSHGNMRVALTNDIHAHCHFYFHTSESSLKNNSKIHCPLDELHSINMCGAMPTITMIRKRDMARRDLRDLSVWPVYQSWRMWRGCHVGSTHCYEILSADAISNHYQWNGWTMMYDSCMLLT